MSCCSEASTCSGLICNCATDDGDGNFPLEVAAKIFEVSSFFKESCGSLLSTFAVFVPRWADKRSACKLFRLFSKLVRTVFALNEFAAS